MPDSTPADEEFARQIIPFVSQTLLREFSHLPQQAIELVRERTLVACLNIHRKAKKKQLNRSMFVSRVVREQVQIWQATMGTPTEQAKAMNHIMIQNQKVVTGYLSSKRFEFKTPDVVNDLVSVSFQAFFDIISRQKSIRSLISTSVMSIAQNKAKQQFRTERTGISKITDWLGTTHVSVEDADMGSFEWPVNGSEGEDDIVSINVSNETVPIEVDRSRLRLWIADCLETLSAKRQLLVRLRYRFWTARELESLTIDQVQALYDEKEMADIAQESGYTNAHTASVRLNESLKQLRDCLTRKMTNPAV